MEQVAFIDLETTGKEVATARIAQIAVRVTTVSSIFGEPDGTDIAFSTMLNPGVPMSPEATQVTGIMDMHLADKKKFKDVASHVLSLLVGSNFLVGGYNIMGFDVPILVSEFERAAKEGWSAPSPVRVDDFKCLDLLMLWQNMERRTLSDAYKRFMGKPLEGAHEAMADVNACIDIAPRMAKAFGIGDIKSMMDSVKPKEWVLNSHHFIYDDRGKIVYGFGKHKGLGVTDNNECRSYLSWIATKGDFPGDIKRFCARVLTGDITPTLDGVKKFGGKL